MEGTKRVVGERLVGKWLQNMLELHDARNEDIVMVSLPGPFESSLYPKGWWPRGCKQRNLFQLHLSDGQKIKV